MNDKQEHALMKLFETHPPSGEIISEHIKELEAKLRDGKSHICAIPHEHRGCAWCRAEDAELALEQLTNAVLVAHRAMIVLEGVGLDYVGTIYPDVGKFLAGIVEKPFDEERERDIRRFQDATIALAKKSLR